MDIYKKWNIGLSIATGVIAGSAWLYWESVCVGGSCSWEIRNFLFRPLIWGNLAFALVVTSLLALPSKLFKQWCIHIVSWSIPLAIFLIIQEDPRSSNILAIGRGLVAWLMGVLLFLVTALYAIGWHIVEVRRGRLAVRDLYKLSVFLISGALMYVIWQQF